MLLMKIKVEISIDRFYIIVLWLPVLDFNESSVYFKRRPVRGY
jgi:hypothetical protein